MTTMKLLQEQGTSSSDQWEAAGSRAVVEGVCTERMVVQGNTSLVSDAAQAVLKAAKEYATLLLLAHAMQMGY